MSTSNLVQFGSKEAKILRGGGEEGADFPPPG